MITDKEAIQIVRRWYEEQGWRTGAMASNGGRTFTPDDAARVQKKCEEKPGFHAHSGLSKIAGVVPVILVETNVGMRGGNGFTTVNAETGELIYTMVAPK